MGQLRRHFGVAFVSHTRAEKRIYIHSSSQKPLISRADGPLGKLWREVWKISKPLIAAYVAKLVGEQAKATENK